MSPGSVELPRVGFVSITRPLFKGDTRAVLETSVAGLRVLARNVGFRLVLGDGDRPQVASDAASALRIAEIVREQHLDFLLVQLTTFATGDVMAPLLAAAPRVGLWGVPERSGGRGAQGPLPLNSLCGLTMGISIAGSPDAPTHAPVKWFYGDVAADAFRVRLEVSVAAARATAALRGSTVLAIGGTAPGFYGLKEVPAVLGVRVEQRPLSDLLERIAAVPAAQATERAEAWRAREAADVTIDQLTRAVRIDLALAAMARDTAADALAVRCWPELPEVCSSMACLALAEQGERHVPAACEGDVMGAVSMLALQAVSRAPAILMDLSDTDPQTESLLLWHCGNAPLAWAAPASGGAPATRLTTHFNRDGTGVVRDLRLRAGPVTGFRLLDGGRRAVVITGDVREPDKPGFDGVRGWLGDLRWAGVAVGVDAFVANILDHRLPHHLAFGLGDSADALMELCASIGAEVLPALTPQSYLRS